MRQGGLVGRVRSKKKGTKTKSRRTQDTPRNSQQPGDRDNLEMACDQKTEKNTNSGAICLLRRIQKKK